MNDCIYTKDELKRDFLDWVKINTNVVNISKVLNNLVNTTEEMNVEWIVYDQDGNIIQVNIPNLASIIAEIKDNAISVNQFDKRSNTMLTSLVALQTQITNIVGFINKIELVGTDGKGMNAKYLDGLKADKFERRDTSQTRIGDVIFTNNTDGVVLADRKTGIQYRLYIDNGNLGIEEV